MEVILSRTTTAASGGEVLRSERIAGGILPKTLNTFDMVAIFIAIVLFITNSPGIAAAGPVAYIYLVAGFLTFLIPGAIVTGQLGRMFPKEGSIYVWTNKAFGPFWGFFAGFCACWPAIQDTRTWRLTGAAGPSRSVAPATSPSLALLFWPCWASRSR